MALNVGGLTFRRNGMLHLLFTQLQYTSYSFNDLKIILMRRSENKSKCVML